MGLLFLLFEKSGYRWSKYYNTSCRKEFSAAYIAGFFDSIEEMEKAYDRHYGWSDIILEPSPNGWSPLA
jgi:hypothetical protein